MKNLKQRMIEDMGATLVIALLRKRRCFVANIGDSRAYRLRTGRFTQLTRDHSVVSELIKRGLIAPDEALSHAASGQLTRYIGMEEKVRSHVRSFALKKHDRILSSSLESSYPWWYTRFCMMKSNLLSVTVSGQIRFGDLTRITVMTGGRPLAKGEHDD